MLNIGRVGPGGHRYYLKQVVAGAEDYYVERGEEPGRWIGDAARTLALDGRVEAADLKAVLEAVDPRTGEKLAGHPARKVAGFDLAFRAPKSVALAWGLTDDPQSPTRSRRRTSPPSVLRSATWSVRRDGPDAGPVGSRSFLVGGSSARRSTTAPHVPVIRCCTPTCWWPTRSAPSMTGCGAPWIRGGCTSTRKTAGLLYQAELRNELTERLGLGWQPVVNGHADLEGFDRNIIEAFSQRRAAIVARLDELGLDSPAAAQVATLTTRQAKDLTASESELREQWRVRAVELGFDPATIEELLHQVEPDRHLVKVDMDGMGELVAGDDGLTAQVASFARRDAVQAVAASLPAGGTVAEIEQLADRLLADGRLVAVGSGPEQLSLLHRTPMDDDGD